jgi:hypothetical protein
MSDTKQVNERFVHILTLRPDGELHEIKGYYTKTQFEELKRNLSQYNDVGEWERYPEFETND